MGQQRRKGADPPDRTMSGRTALHRFGTALLWFNQRPTDGGEWPGAWLNVEIVSPWRSAGTPRFIAAAEVACAEYFNPVIPEVLAEQLRALS
jgi:galactose-1-phosphate uridylyltransferase